MDTALDEAKFFDPFPEKADYLSLNYPEFEKLQRECSFYSPSQLKLHLDASNNFNIIHANIRSIVNKLDAFEGFLKSCVVNWQIICLSETWLNTFIEPMYNLESYKSFFCSRTEKSAGGSAIYVKNNLKPSQLHHPPFSTAEVVCVEFETNMQQKLIICQIYRAPNTNKVDFLAEMELFLIWLVDRRRVAFVSGDFNFDLFNIHSCHYTQEFFNLMCSYGFFSSISKTTRLSSTSSLIDNIFCNNLSLVRCSGIIIDDLSDHFPIYISVNMTIKDDKLAEKCKHFTRFNYRCVEEMKQFLNQELENILQENDPDLIAERIIKAYHDGIEKYSYKQSNNRKVSPRKPWISPAILASINRKNDLYRAKLKHPCQDNNERYHTYRNILKTVLKKAKKMFYENKFNENRNNPKKMWATISELMGKSTDNDSAPKHICNTEGVRISDNAVQAEILNNYFSEIGLELKSKILRVDFDPIAPIARVDEEMTLNLTTEQELTDVIMKLNNVGAGYDGINSKIFKCTFQSIINILIHFFNTCLRAGVFPNLLKIAVIKPIYKGGDSSEKNNYRPISMLPFMSKILEKLIENRLSLHLLNNSILHDKQFGFQKGRSTYMPHLLLQDTITKSFEESEYAIGIYLDLRKAFDTVDTEILLKKLDKYGIRSKSLDILTSYLQGRKQCVKINDNISDFREVRIGVPQGSILGPTLFSLYINDLPKISPDMTCLLYADDTAIILKQKNIDDLQNNVHQIMPKLSLWLAANYLSLNITKTFTQHYSLATPNFRVDVRINGSSINEKDDVLYLGVIIDKSMKFSSHIKQVANTISRNIGVISRIRYYIDPKIAYLLYNSMILPYLNYCCMIWGINYASQLQNLTVLQKRAVRLILKVYPPTSSQPIFKEYKILKIPDLAKTQMILVMHRFLTNQLPESIKTLYAVEDVVRIRRFKKHIKIPFSNRNYRIFTTSISGPKLWNEICAPLYNTIDMIPRSKQIIKNVCKRKFLGD